MSAVDKVAMVDKSDVVLVIDGVTYWTRWSRFGPVTACNIAFRKDPEKPPTVLYGSTFCHTCDEFDTLAGRRFSAMRACGLLTPVDEYWLPRKDEKPKKYRAIFRAVCEYLDGIERVVMSIEGTT